MTREYLKNQIKHKCYHEQCMLSTCTTINNLITTLYVVMSNTCFENLSNKSFSKLSTSSSTR